MWRINSSAPARLKNCHTSPVILQCSILHNVFYKQIKKKKKTFKSTEVVFLNNAFVAQWSVQELSEEEGQVLSPGLSYLEQVCQMLEEIARQQMHSRALQRQMNALQEHRDTEVNQVTALM